MKKIASVGLAMAMFVAGCSKAAKNIGGDLCFPAYVSASFLHAGS